MKTQKKFYLIYQITNTINGKIYIGKHKTDQLDDEYMGSGKHLHNAFNKYGLENFIMTILFYLQNEDEMNLLEKMVVTKEFCDREDTYNLNVGGDGGWLMVNNNAEHHKSLCKKGGQNMKKKVLNMTPKERREYGQKLSVGIKAAWKKIGHCWTGRHHSEETKMKMRHPHPSANGKGNSQYGKMWICNDQTSESRSIWKTDPIPPGWRKGRICKK